MSENREHQAPEHVVDDGPVRGNWRGADITDDELVDDEWIKANTRRLEDGVD